MADENSHGVNWGRYDAEHHALVERVYLLEQRAEVLRDAESIHADLLNRIGKLEADTRDNVARNAIRKDRMWLLVLAILTGVVSPLLVTTVLIWLHLRTLS